MEHTVSGDGFDSGDVAAGKTVTFTAPSTAGSYPIHCEYHSQMGGTLVVGSAGDTGATSSGAGGGSTY